MTLHRRRSGHPVAFEARCAGARPGFALFMALGALVIIGVLVAASSFISLQEVRLGQNALEQAKAFSVAEYGLNKIQQDWDKTPNLTLDPGESYPETGDATYYLDQAHPEKGVAKVRYTRLNDETFWIVSEGKAYLGDGTDESRVAIKRVGGILRLRIPTVKANAAITAGGNVAIKGGADVTGINTTPPGWGEDCDGITGTDKPGAVVPTGNTVTTQGSSTITGSTGSGWATDSLASNEDTYIRYGDETWNTLVEQANIKVNGGTFNDNAPTLNGDGSCNKTDVNNWGEPWHTAEHSDAKTLCNTYFPIIYSNGSISLNGQGRGQGILLVNGDVSINGHFEWYGLIIVTDDIIRGNGTADVYGGVMARNEVVADESTISGSTTYSYSACALERAMRGSAQVVQAKERSWTELY